MGSVYMRDMSVGRLDADGDHTEPDEVTGAEAYDKVEVSLLSSVLVHVVARRRGREGDARKRLLQGMRAVQHEGYTNRTFVLLPSSVQ